MKRWIGIVLVNAVLLVLGMMAVEVAHRVYRARRGGVDWNDRYLFIEGARPVNQDGFWTYQANRSYRELAFWAHRFAAPSLEYDCTSSTDDLGFLDNRVPLDEATLLILGDSFTAGQGGCPWVPRLAERLTGVYSAGLPGTGFLHWRRIHEFLAARARFERIVVIFVADDFRRDAWLWDDRQIACLEDATRCRHEYWFPATSEVGEVLRRRIAQRRHGSIAKAASTWLPFSSGLFTQAAEALRPASVPDDGGGVDVFERALRAAEDLHRLGAILIHVSTRDESFRGKWNSRSEKARGALARAGIHPVECMLQRADFMPNDGHPNRAGYDKLIGCVLLALR